jgi:hypothetical protein
MCLHMRNRLYGTNMDLPKDTLYNERYLESLLRTPLTPPSSLAKRRSISRVVMVIFWFNAMILTKEPSNISILAKASPCLHIEC